MKTLLIVNPTSGHGTMQKQWHVIEATLRAENFAYDVVFTERQGHGIELARQAADAGYDLVAAVGGDGTLNETANGLLQSGKRDVALGLITSGTGGDFARTAGIAHDTVASAQQLARAQTTRTIDAGEIVFTRQGKETQRYFVNVAGMGFDAEVIERTERRGKRTGGTIPYLTTLISTISVYRNKDVTLTIDEQRIEGRVNSVIVCNGKYFGGGMKVGPNAALDDGIFHVVIIGNMNTFEVLTNTPKIYNGSHLTLKKISEYRGKNVTAQAKQLMLIQADGEFIGPGPATFRVCPGALKLRC